MIRKYFKTKKYLNAFVFKTFDSIEPLSFPNKLSVTPCCLRQYQFMSLALAQLLIAFLLLSKVSKFRQTLYSYLYLISRQHGMERSEAFETGALGSVPISLIYLLGKREQLLTYSETDFVISSIWIVIAHRLVGITCECRSIMSEHTQMAIMRTPSKIAVPLT